MHFYRKDAAERGRWVGEPVDEDVYKEEMPVPRSFEARSNFLFSKPRTTEGSWDNMVVVNP